MTIEDMIERDSSFSESSFISKVDNTFVMLLSGVMTWDIDRVKHKISSELYDIYKTKVDNLKANNQRQMYDELNVKSTKIQSITETEDEYIIVVLLVSTYMDYRVDATSLKYISGINDHRIEKFNNLTFKKKKNFKNNNGVNECPNCGASVNINNTGICEFCHKTFNLSDYDWILTNIS